MDNEDDENNDDETEVIECADGYVSMSIDGTHICGKNVSVSTNNQVNGVFSIFAID